MNKCSRILGCGGRDFGDDKLFHDVMVEAQQYFADKFCIIEGGATGADRMFRNWGRIRGLPVLTVGADWGYYGKAAGPVRNTWMLDWAMPDLVIAMPGNVGTPDMIKQAKARGIIVFDL